jgi:NAD(P)-dependent dehydrogenase (short-subunit alcohol dehydrogenase family)
MELRGKVAVVTGAASGIGHAMVRRFLDAGMRVVMADIEEAALETAAEAFPSRRGDVLPVVTDVCDPEAVDSLAVSAEEAFGPVHLLCSNAGVSTFGKSWEQGLDDWRWVLGVNLGGVIHGIRTFVPRFIAQGEGHVVNTSSMAGVAIYPSLGPYTASKHAVVALSEVLALDLRASGSDVGVSVLCPGCVRTRISQSERNRPSTDAGSGGERLAGSVTGLLDGGTDPAEVADLVARAVEANEFWIFSHPEMLPGVELRMTSILNQAQPETAFRDLIRRDSR